MMGWFFCERMIQVESINEGNNSRHGNLRRGEKKPPLSRGKRGANETPCGGPKG